MVAKSIDSKYSLNIVVLMYRAKNKVETFLVLFKLILIK